VIGSGGTGNTPPVSPSQGFNGASHSGVPYPSPGYGAGGGGGAGEAGNTNGLSRGGDGLTNSISGSSVTYAGGGGGGVCGSGTAGDGGAGGGGSGGKSGQPVAGAAGTVNTGGGGGGGFATSGASGGSGIVIVRAPGSANLSASPGTNTVTTLPAPAGGCKVATFTVSGTLTT
jgi:hypothetical protein